MSSPNPLAVRVLSWLLPVAGMVALAGCDAGGGAGPGWQEHAGRGYVMRHPPGWRVTETDDHRIRIESDAGAWTLTTVVLPGVRADNLSPHMVQNCTGTGIDLRRFQADSPYSMRAWEDRGDVYETSAIQYRPADNGITLMCATVVAGRSGFDDFVATAAEVVASMRPAAGAPAAAPAAASAPTDWRSVPMVRHQDPEEGAFTVDIPQGWSFRGGTGRVHVLETRQWYIASSPDGEITIIYGDPDVPRFIERDPWGMSPPGTWHNTDFSGSFMIWPYQEGLAFAQARAREFFGSYPDFRVDEGEQVDLTMPTRQDRARTHPMLAENITAGLSAFTFSHEGRGFSGAYWAETARFPQYGSWGLITAARIVAPPGRIEEAMNLFARMIPVPDPQWEQRQQAGAMRNQRIMTDSFAETNRMIRESYESRVASSERGTRDFVDAIWGTQRLEDPGTGQRYEMQHGSLSYWLHDDGTVVGTDGYNNPHPSHFRELLQVGN